MILLLFPHQLFPPEILPENIRTVYLIEEYLFFNQYRFHKQKIAFHRTTMKSYEAELIHAGFKVVYLDSQDKIADIRNLIPFLRKKNTEEIALFDPTDNWLRSRIEKKSNEYGLQITFLNNPSFLNSPEENRELFPEKKKKFLQNNFYIHQRKRWNILLDASGSPLGGKWSFDEDNRKRYPKGKNPPPLHFPSNNQFYSESVNYTQKYFDDHPGSLSPFPLYPTDRKEANQWLNDFLEHRFAEFGPYEDAIVSNQTMLHHSVLSPLLNCGLLLPKEVIEKTLLYAEKNSIPLSSVEGFIRQIIGWREFIRGVYDSRGSVQRTTNYWGFKRKIPETFYRANTGITPIDQTIRKILRSGYCHHIERLMVLGNFMLLCEFDPDDVYQWFMELFIDAYDWVMVPNVYGMSQFADGGIFATKPYISGSNYLMKMSDYPKGEWQTIWDALFWRFLHVHRNFFTTNPRLSMLIRNWDKQSPEKKESLLQIAESYLQHLDRTITES